MSQINTCGPTYTSHTAVMLMSLQAERTSIALQSNHPELKNVWVNLETNTRKDNPQKAMQPSNLKITLLPFQLESLFWMKMQEKGVWRGGILAVKIIYTPLLYKNLTLIYPGRDGVCHFSTQTHVSICQCRFACRMGKTIQIISLFVSDVQRPNLVIAHVFPSINLCFMLNVFVDPPSPSCSGGMKLKLTVTG